MNIIVIGAGRVGIRLAVQLDAEGHEVTIIDSDEDSLNTLPDSFGGFKTPGIPIDQDVLRNANIANCDALAAVSPNDNMNIMISQLAKEIFKVPKVLARICDPKREDVFSHFGIQTICPTNISVSAIKSSLTDSALPQHIHLGTSTISFTCKPIETDQIGTFVSDYKLEEFEDINYLLKNSENKKDKKDKITNHIYAILHENNELEVYKNKPLRFTKGDKVVISTIVD